MKVQTVTVEIHEKRNHPYEYGHFDASVSYTVQVEEGEDADLIIKSVQAKAREHVEAELDAKIEAVNLERKRSEARSNLHWVISRADHAEHTDIDAQQFEKNVQLLEPDEQVEYRGKLDRAKEEYWAAMRNNLNGYIDKAERNKADSFDIDCFNTQLEYMPEAERSDFLQRMEAALGRAEATAKAEEIPY